MINAWKDEGALAQLFINGIVGEKGKATLSVISGNITTVGEELSKIRPTDAQSWFEEKLDKTQLPPKDYFGANGKAKFENTLEEIFKLVKQTYDGLND